MTKQIEKKLSDLFKKNKKTIAIAESCTGGMASGLITNMPGSSLYFKGGIIAYSNSVKVDILKVSEKIIQRRGAVSRLCAVAMARNVRKMFDTNIGVGITGIAGPGGSSRRKPVGTVYVCVTDSKKTICRLLQLTGSRMDIRKKTSVIAVNMIIGMFNDKND